MAKEINFLGEMYDELPIKVKASFESLEKHWEELSKSDDVSLATRADALLAKLRSIPELSKPFDDLSLLDKYAAEIEEFFEPVFPDLLQDNEIMGLSLPFRKTIFNPTRRMKGIMERSGDDAEIKVVNFDIDYAYVMISIGILNSQFGTHIDHKMPLYFKIHDSHAGVDRFYRAFFNVDFVTFKRNENSPSLTQDDIDLLINNYDNIDLWKEKIPPESFDYEGFSIIKLFDVTIDQALSSMKNVLLRPNALASATHVSSLEVDLRSYFGLGDLELAMVTFDKQSMKLRGLGSNIWHCNFMDHGLMEPAKSVFCDHSMHHLFNDGEGFVVSNLDKETRLPHNLRQRLIENNVKSYILTPLVYNDETIGLLELSSKEIYALNSITANKLNDLIPLFTIALRRAKEEQANKIDAIIQGEFTALHPSVSWKFRDVAEKILDSREEGKPDYEEEVVFKDVVPLYGQFDIRGSSNARNDAIQADLIKQLTAAESVLEIAAMESDLPIYDHLTFRIESCIDDLRSGISAGDEAKVREFLKKEVYPVFNFLNAQGAKLENAVANYKSLLHDELELVYEHRKAYEDSVTYINAAVQETIEEHQVQAQAMFPHYFEKFKTDGVEFNIYVGESIANNEAYDPMYLSNLRLWQLLMSHSVEVRLRKLRDELPVPLEIASLILAHNTPLSIKFRMDEMQFDVDGAYNIRYEIVKKRIDKAYIKGTTERLTQPGKIAVVYSHEDEGREYRNYFEFLHSINKVEGEIEDVELQDLQGASGLRAIRANVVYDEVSEESAIETMIEQLSK